MKKLLDRSFLYLFFLAGLVACQSTEIENQSTNSGEILKPTYAKHFEIVKQDSCSIIRIFNPWKPGDIMQELVVSQYPKKNKHEIEAPIRSIIPLSTSFYGYIESLGQLTTVTAIENKSFVFNSILLEKLANNSLIEIGQSGNISIERTIELGPSLVMVSGNELISQNLNKIIQANIPVLQNMDWQEQHPLGKAEWIKVFGVLYHQEQKADSLFNAVKEKYLSLAKLANDSATSNKPTVLLGYNYQGTWYLPGGRSYVSQYLRDAGYNYAYSTDTATASLAISAELIYDQFKSADFWFHPGACKTKEELLQLDKRYRFFTSFTQQTIYNNSLRTISSGGNDFWETSPCNPHLVLADLIKIAYPTKLPEHKLYFYQQLR